MGKTFEGIISATLIVGMAVGDQYAIKRTFFVVQMAALTKTAQGLPPFAPFAQRLTGK